MAAMTYTILEFSESLISSNDVYLYTYSGHHCF